MVPFTDRTTLTHDTPIPIDTTGSTGFERIPDISGLYDEAVLDETNIGILYEWASTEIPADSIFPIVTDFFSFGFEDDGNQASERVANQIIRLELEEDADNTGKFIGTLEYTMVNQLNILEEGTYTGLTTISNKPKHTCLLYTSDAADE